MRFFAAVLVGTVLTSIEFIYILLTNGPFWLDPGGYFLLWLIYSGATIIGISALYPILIHIPLMLRIHQHSNRQFLFYFLIIWLFGSLFLTLIIWKDVEILSPRIFFLFLNAGVGLIVVLLTWVWITKEKVRIFRAIILIVLLIILSNGSYLLSDSLHASAVRTRSADYQGVIPHLLLLVLDTTRGDHFSGNGYSFATTPNMDQIAQEGLNCRNAYSASNWTPPGHISVFTGKYPSQHGNDGLPYMPDSLLSLTEILNQKGYYCVAMYDNPVAGRYTNITQGFDRDYSFFRYTWTYPAPWRIWHRFVQRHSRAKVTFSMA